MCVEFTAICSIASFLAIPEPLVSVKVEYKVWVFVGSKSIFGAQVPTQLQSSSSKILGIKWSQVGGEANSGHDVGIELGGIMNLKT